MKKSPMIAAALLAGMATTSFAQDAAINFDALRGNAYYNAAFGNMAGAFTVNDYLAWPHLMGGSKFLYVEPTAETGTAAWNMGNITPFISLQNAMGGNIGQTVLGFANSKFGVSLNIAKDYEGTSSENGANTTETSTTGTGDMIGINASANLGKIAVQSNFSLTTVLDENDNETVIDSTSTSQDDSFYQLIAGINVSNFPSAQSLYWLAGISVDRLNLESESKVGNTTTTTPDAANRTIIKLYASEGVKVLGNAKSRVLIGADQLLSIAMPDEITGTRESAMGSAFYLTPNLVGEYAFNPKWIVFGGASHAINLFEMSSYSAGATDNSGFAMETGTTTASAGVRYQNENFAAEASLSDALFSDGTSALFNGNNILASFGAFLYF